MMENAGRNLALLARQRFLQDDPRGKRVIVLAGTGGNGGGALVFFFALDALPSWEYFTQAVPEGTLNIIQPADDPHLPWPGLMSGLIIVGIGTGVALDLGAEHKCVAPAPRGTGAEDDDVVEFNIPFVDLFVPEEHPSGVDVEAERIEVLRPEDHYRGIGAA